ncbi:MAG TPA: hypothetical protein VK053_07505 [Jiangellaceae bacterium]|nr:hypothetical protein [Jiangellaceae bacterium]
MTEPIVWTIVFLGGDLLVLVILLVFAVLKDREKLRAARQGD